MLQGVPGSMKTLTLILNVIFNCINLELLTKNDFIIVKNKFGLGDIQTINLPQLSPEKLPNSSVPVHIWSYCAKLPYSSNLLLASFQINAN